MQRLLRFRPSLSKVNLPLLLLALVLPSCQPAMEQAAGITFKPDRLSNLVDWGIYRGDKQASQYADLAQINAANVHHLEPVWTYHTQDATNRSSMQCNPIIVDGLMYLSTFSLNAIALDAATGEEKWVFKSVEHNENKADLKGRNRGVTYWEGDAKARIFHFVHHRVYALDAKSGKLISTFGEGGYLDLRNHLDMDASLAAVEVTTPGVIFQDLLIVSSRVTEGYQSTPGHIRAFDAKTGAFKWIFHTIPQAGEFGYDTWEWVEGERYGGANAWGGLTVDEQRGWVFCATGSPAPDFYGGYRKGMNLFGNCVLALDATTGERQWHFQTVHHDLWDYDNPSAPILVTLKDHGKTQDVVVQLTKMGFTFVLDRDSGEPIFPVEELPVPPSTVAGEEAWPTQPFPVRPPPLSRLQITAADLSQVTPVSYASALHHFSKYQSGPIFTPPSLLGGITAPGHLGGVEWHGGSFDPTRNILYVNSNDGPTLNRLKQIYDLGEGENSLLQQGHLIYQGSCASCHGSGRQGIDPIYPALLNLESSRNQIRETIKNGRGIMPAFSQLSSKQLDALTEYLTSDSINQPTPTTSAADGAKRYTLEGYQMMHDPYGAPAISPPWGTLNAIDLKAGTIVWKVPLGEYPNLVAQGIRNTGSMNYGGCVGTAGGVVFVAATYDEKIRAFEKVTGKLLWEHPLPAGGYATPSIYQIDGKQYITIVAGGGGKNGTKSSDAVVTFALPDSENEKEMVESEPDTSQWIDLFDGKTLAGWVQMNGFHKYTVENKAIVGTTVAGSDNSFLCSLREFADFELEVEVMIDDVTNSGIQFRSQARPITIKEGNQWAAGRVYGPQAEIRRNLGKDSPTTGVLYGEALGTGWLSAKDKFENGHHYFFDEAWNLLRIRAVGPRMQTWVNGQAVEDLVNEEVYQTHPKGFIGLQIHGIKDQGPFVMKWRNIRVREL